jgi:signal transduction histidine kinase
MVVIPVVYAATHSDLGVSGPPANKQELYLVGPWGAPMTASFRIPSDVWGWRGTTLVLVALVVPLAGVLTLAPADSATEAVGPARAVLVAAAMLAAAVLVHVHGRLAGNDQSLWVSAALALSAVAGLLLVGGRHELPQHLIVPGLSAVLGMATLILVIALVRVSTLPLWVRARFAGAASLTAASAAVAAVSDGPASAVVALLCGLVGAIVLATTAAALLRLELGQAREHLVAMHTRLSGLEREYRADQVRWHEMNTIVAGVASASRLIAETPMSDHRSGLQTMVLAELDRLQRLLAERGPAATTQARTAVDVDELVERIVLSHLSRGQGVSWEPSGLEVRARADDIAEVLDILVENAAVHGRPEGIRVTTERVGGAVEIAVVDQGPGVTPEVRAHLFDWGCRREGSPGHGIGLYSAAELTRSFGGEVRLDGQGPGARFVLRIPDAPEQDPVDGRASLAHLAP